MRQFYKIASSGILYLQKKIKKIKEKQKPLKIYEKKSIYVKFAYI